MKTKLLLTLFTLACGSLLHAEKIAAGPKGGRLLDSTPLKAEFLVTTERRVEVTFYDDHSNPILPGAQLVAVTAEPASGRVALEMEKTATHFASKTALPAGEPYRVVVQIRATPDAKPQNFRLDLNLATCGECQRKEYACTCEGH
ncbi:hypothetical protein ESB00_04315 [Oleiharenicola lentus]|uniref:Uncharacterized protein n=1 Tax=Oleiharenicola lentus TaxID=2508720 RepID=A0A4Q1C8B3_9BACT|nr:hypothetical protein [Oleiharenicola lentus]RXK55128.1 hypothetical protein ESB00_04315 [Oleiharenicola lentus]